MLKDLLVSLGAGLGLFGAIPASSPIPFDDVVVGSGDMVTFGQRVTVHMLVTDPSGREYANTKKRGLPYTFQVAERSPDPVSQGVLGMKVGGQRRLNLDAQSSSAYSQLVPANTPLVVIVTLVKAAGR